MASNNLLFCWFGYHNYKSPLWRKGQNKPVTEIEYHKPLKYTRMDWRLRIHPVFYICGVLRQWSRTNKSGLLRIFILPRQSKRVLKHSLAEYTGLDSGLFFVFKVSSPWTYRQSIDRTTRRQTANASWSRQTLLKSNTLYMFRSPDDLSW